MATPYKFICYGYIGHLREFRIRWRITSFIKQIWRICFAL